MATKGRKAKPIPKTKKIGGKKFSKVSCSKSKATAKKSAKALREKGYTARVLKDSVNKTHCVMKGAKSKK